MRIGTLLLLVFAVGLLPAAQVELADGRHLEGTIVRQTDDQLDLRVQSGGITAVLHLPRDQVVAIDPAVSPRRRQLQRIEERYRTAADAKDAGAVWRLAEELRELGASIAWRRMLRRVLDLAPDHEAARQALGYELVDGEWLQGDELMRAKGMVLYAGRWVTPAERDRLEAEEERRQQIRLELAQRRAERAQSAGNTTGVSHFGFSTGSYSSSGYGSYGYPRYYGYPWYHRYPRYYRYGYDRCDDGPSVLITPPGFNGSDEVQIHHLRRPYRRPVIIRPAAPAVE